MLLRLTICLTILSCFFACQNAAEQKTATAETSIETSVSATKRDPVYVKGLELVGKSDCLTCHKIDDKLIGPSYKEIAKKYAGAPNDVVTALARTIIKGGSGNWGNVPMTPHPAVSQEDAETMVRYILTLN
jgi:cytochrome c